MDKDKEPVEQILKRYDHDPANLIMVMQDIQAAFNYLPAAAIDLVAEKLHLPRSRIYAVATFYKSFSLQPRGKHRIEICEGTACHIRGSSVLMNQAVESLGIKAGETTADGEYSLESVHCVGACAMGPVAVIDGRHYGNITAPQLAREIKKCSAGHPCAAAPGVSGSQGAERSITAADRISSFEDFTRLQARLREENPLDGPRILVCADTGCIVKGSLDVAAALVRELAAAGMERQVNMGVKRVGCQGLCEMGPLVILHPENILYTGVRPGDANDIVQQTLLEKKTINRLLYREPGEETGIEQFAEIPFYSGQQRTVLRRVGFVDPLDIGDYMARGGYGALMKALYTMEPAAVIDAVEQSGLRGRGGGGFPTGKKWRTAAAVPSAIRYVICNGDEGDPGAFMDRSIMEGDPHAVLEGMAICAFAVGAAQGYIYVRKEYPRALTVLQTAIEQAGERGLLGPNVGGSSFSFDIRINCGSGAFVCGESTALMQSIEGRVGEPRAKYIRSAERGLYDAPTVLNNVETFANIPVIIEEGARSFASTGTDGSKGTKVFAVVGKVKNTGLIEVPMGTTLRTIIFDICGGILNDKKFKAVQTGGPSGGCLPESKLDLPVDFDTLTREGSMMGSGGMIVMDEDTCMVDVARYFTGFLAGESCGKCAACRYGIDALHAILERICSGEGELEDLDRIERLLLILEKGSLCMLGKSAPNPVRSTLAHFKEEYLAHINEKRCPAGVCRSLISFEIGENCNGCGLCALACPQKAISGEDNERHSIDQQLCNRCGICKAGCKYDAIATTGFPNPDFAEPRP